MDNKRFKNKTPVHTQLIVFDADTPSFDLTEGEVTLGTYSFCVGTVGWEYESIDLSLIDVGKVEVSLGVSIAEGNIGVGAMATAWAPSISFKIGDIKICLQANVGSIGAEAGYFADKGFSAGFSYGWGASIGLKWAD